MLGFLKNYANPCVENLAVKPQCQNKYGEQMHLLSVSLNNPNLTYIYSDVGFLASKIV